jgi:hypothetical protein
MRRTLPGRRLVLETIDDAAGGAHSLPELELLRGLRAAGLPEPARQRKLQHADGTWYLDNDFTAYLVTVEVNGIQHYEQLLREADDFQRAVLQISGRIVVDLSSYAVRHQQEQSMLLIAESLVSHGWQPSPRAVRVLTAYRTGSAGSWAPSRRPDANAEADRLPSCWIDRQPVHFGGN